MEINFLVEQSLKDFILTTFKKPIEEKVPLEKSAMNSLKELSDKIKVFISSGES